MKRELHPARFSDTIIDYFRVIIPEGMHIHDPFAGDGVKLGKLCDRLGVAFSGTEIEAPFIRDPRVRHGNSRYAKSYPRRRPFWICTSPSYPNGVADHFEAKDDSKRKTYRQARAKMVGYDQPLDPSNMGAYGYRGTKRGGGSVKRERYWEIANDCVRWWDKAEKVILNVSDFKQKRGEIEPLVADWIDLMVWRGWVVESDFDVSTPRMKHGSKKSRDERVEVERVITFVRG